MPGKLLKSRRIGSGIASDTEFFSLISGHGVADLRARSSNSAHGAADLRVPGELALRARKGGLRPGVCISAPGEAFPGPDFRFPRPEARISEHGARRSVARSTERRSERNSGQGDDGSVLRVCLRAPDLFTPRTGPIPESMRAAGGQTWCAG